MTVIIVIQIYSSNPSDLMKQALFIIHVLEIRKLRYEETQLLASVTEWRANEMILLTWANF